MFARRRSSLSLDRLVYLYIAFLTCSLFVIGPVSSMSLDRLGQQYQQQNDKQLEFSELMLPEAESELLQSDMELVPAVDGNSDMYLLVPASTVGQEENLQTLTESNKVQNSGNVERTSDMLMMESEDTPAMQILELPKYTIETKTGEGLAINNYLNQDLNNKDKIQTFNNREEISEIAINAIAEAAQEIKNEIETELEDSEETLKREKLAESENDKQEKEISSSNEFPLENKDSETENADNSDQDLENQEQEMIGVVMEESNETPAVSLEIKNSQDSEKHDEDLQDEETKQSEEQSVKESASKENQSDENSSDQTDERENGNVGQENTETKILNYENDQGEELEEQKNAANIEMQDVEEMESLAADDMQSEDQEVGKHLTEQDTQDDYKILSVEEPQLDEEIKPSAEETFKASDETEDKADETNSDVEMQVAADGHENEEANDEIQSFSVKSQVTENVSLKAESLKETQDLADLQGDEEKIEHLEELGNALADDEKQPAHETQSDNKTQSAETNTNFTNFVHLEEFDKSEPAELIAESQIVEEFSKADEKITPTEASHVSDSNEEDEKRQEQLDKIQLDNKEESISEDQQGQEVQPVEESQQVLKIQHANQSEDFEDNISNIENIDTQGDETEPTRQTEQIPQKTLNVEEQQYIEESLNLNNVLSVEEAQTAEEMNVQNLQTVEEVSYDKELAAVPEAQSSEVAHIQDVKEAQSYEQFQSIEAHNTLDESPEIEDSQSNSMSQSVEESQNNEEAQLVENMQSTDDLQIAGVQHPAEEGPKLTEENPTKVEDNKTAAEDVSQPPLKFPVEQQESKPVDTAPEKTPVDEILAAESYKPHNKEIANQSVVLADENPVDIKGNKNEQLQEESAETQRPLENITQNITNESESMNMLTTILQAPTNEELTQQQVQHEQLKVQEQQQQQKPALVETISSTTLKPFNVMDSVLNYVNASFMNQMSNDNNNNNNKIDEVKNNKKVFNSKLRRYDGAQVWRIVVQNERERKLADELQSKFDGQLWKEVKQEVDYLLKPHVLADAEHHVRAANLTRIILIDNLQKVIEVENPPAEEIAQLQNRNGCRLTWQAYHRLDDIHAYFDYLAKTYPDICSVEIIGYSLEKRPLKILKISNGNAQNPGIWIDGGMHAREWVSPAVVTYIANQIVEGWDDLPEYMRNINWYIHAVANPDGYEYSHTTDRLWRKNKRSHGRACPGVDLNRNFGYKWGGKGTSANPCSQTYRGVKAFSEPETFYISKFISNFPRETFKAYLSFHSYGQYILYPWGYDAHITKDMADLDLVARQAGTIITKSTGAKFTVGSSATTLYPAAGGSDDWAKGIAGIKYSYTIEMGDTGRYGFILPASHIVSNGKNGMTFVETVAKAVTMGKNGRRRRLKAFKSH